MAKWISLFAVLAGGIVMWWGLETDREFDAATLGAGILIAGSLSLVLALITKDHDGI